MRALFLLLLLPCSALADAPGRTEFEEARRLFDAGDAARALPLFEKAYQLSKHRPSTVLALALCERELAMSQQALAHLDEYLAAVPAEVATYRSIREELAAKTAPIEAAPPVPPPPPRAIEPEPPPPPPLASPPEQAIAERAPGLSALKISLFASGGAAVLTGVVFAVLAARAHSDVGNRVEEGRGPQEVIDDRAEEGFRFAVTADVLIGAGLVAAGVGFFVD